MTPKPYKENKNSLKTFLEKNNLAPVPKEAKDKKPNKYPANRYFILLQRLISKAYPEDLARLKAIGWDGLKEPSLKYDKLAYERLKHLEKQDEFENNGGSSWYMFYKLQNTEPCYYVAGKKYRDRADFLFSQTGLGEALS